MAWVLVWTSTWRDYRCLIKLAVCAHLGGWSVRPLWGAYAVSSERLAGVSVRGAWGCCSVCGPWGGAA